MISWLCKRLGQTYSRDLCWFDSHLKRLASCTRWSRRQRRQRKSHCRCKNAPISDRPRCGTSNQISCNEGSSLEQTAQNEHTKIIDSSWNCVAQTNECFQFQSKNFKSSPSKLTMQLLLTWFFVLKNKSNSNPHSIPNRNSLGGMGSGTSAPGRQTSFAATAVNTNG